MDGADVCILRQRCVDCAATVTRSDVGAGDGAGDTAWIYSDSAASKEQDMIHSRVVISIKTTTLIGSK